MTETTTPADQVRLLEQYRRERDTDRASIASLTAALNDALHETRRLREQTARSGQLAEWLGEARAENARLRGEHGEYVRRTDREVYSSLRECEYVRGTLHRARVAIDKGEPLETVRGMIAATHLDLVGPQSSERAAVEADAWCEYWRREADEARRECVAVQAENLAVLNIIDAALVDEDAPEDTGEADDAGELLDAAETLAVRYGLMQREVVRLATEVERLSAGEMPLPGAPELTGGPARCGWCGRPGHTEDDHPLPKDHPQYDAFYDASDRELSSMVPTRPELTGGAR